MSDDDIPGDPVCYASKIIGGHIVDLQTFRDVSQFRKSERARLVEGRRRLENSERQEKTTQLIAHLRRILQENPAEKIAVY
ncbi:MAG: 5-formyltetrahydrofolate cyclo-ligase, partial [Roseibium sp.]|nr:5-formyltetrahydrofolate cyclo-ligase [Roseibium sp.]